ncbi:MAG: fibronectin type III domain-containing protein [Bacteroidota bacterium]
MWQGNLYRRIREVISNCCQNYEVLQGGEGVEAGTILKQSIIEYCDGSTQISWYILPSGQKITTVPSNLRIIGTSSTTTGGGGSVDLVAPVLLEARPTGSIVFDDPSAAPFFLFDKAVRFSGGGGSIQIVRTADGVAVASYADDTNVQFLSGNTVIQLQNYSLAAGTDYTLFIQPNTLESLNGVAFSGLIGGVFNFSTQATGDTQAPSAPVLSFSNVTRTEAQLNWTAASDNVGVVEYRLYIDAGLLINLQPNQTSYTATGLLPGAEHDFYVEAVDAAGNVTASNTVNVVLGRSFDESFDLSFD